MQVLKKRIKEASDDLAINRISKKADFIINVIFFLWALACVLPLLLVVVVSFSSEQSIFQNGYSFFPSEWSLDAYRFFFKLGDQLVRSYGITLFVTVAGTLFSLAITAMFGYVLSRSDYAYNRVFTLLMLFTMLFNGGLIPNYILIQKLGLLDSRLALILPTAISVFNLVILRTSFLGIPDSLEESAKLDGANDMQIFLRIVLPLSKASLAVIILFIAVMHWNSWFSASLYLTSRSKYPLQIILREILVDGSTNMISAGANASITIYKTLIKYCTVIVATLPILLIYPFIQKYFTRGVMVGAIKG